MFFVLNIKTLFLPYFTVARVSNVYLLSPTLGDIIPFRVGIALIGSTLQKPLFFCVYEGCQAFCFGVYNGNTTDNFKLYKGFSRLNSKVKIILR